MRGSVTRKKGRRGWCVVVDHGRDADGKRQQKWHSGYATKRDAERALTEIVSRLDRDEYVATSKLTLEMYLRESWLPAVKSRLRASTLALYTMNVNAYIVPQLGSRRLQSLKPDDLNRLYAAMLDGSLSSRPLSTSTVRNVHVVLHRALEDALRWGRVSRNVAKLADPPRAKHREMQTWSTDELRTFLDHTSDDRLSALWLLLATTGMRRGEALGLHWRSVDLDAARLSVSSSLVVVDGKLVMQEPKTAGGRRTVALYAVTVGALRAHRARQLQERLIVGTDYADDDLVFAREDGSPLHPTTASRAFCARAKQAGLREIRLHDLRHTHAVLGLEAGVHPKIMQERLGHASISLTLDTYSHVMPGMQEQAAQLMAERLFGK